MVSQDREQVNAAPARHQPGMFETFLGSSVPHLQADHDQYPDKYEPELAPLLDALARGTKTLTTLEPAERALLDRAVVDYASAPKPKPFKPPARPREQDPEPTTRQRPAEDEPRPGVDVPADLEMPAYWWIR